jgi:hypothetical protein
MIRYRDIKRSGAPPLLSRSFALLPTRHCQCRYRCTGVVGGSSQLSAPGRAGIAGGQSGR